MAQLILSTKGFMPRGNALKAYSCRDEEIIFGGEVNSGKTYVNEQKAHQYCIKYKNARILFVMKTLTQLMRTGVQTYEEEILPFPIRHPKCPVAKKDDKYLGTFYEYKHNGSKIFLGGLKDKSSTLGTEYDAIVVVQAEQIHEDDWQALYTRIGRGVGKNGPYHFLIGCANPHPLGERHWIRKRKSITYFSASRKDHPGLWNEETQTFTEEGQIIEDRYQKLTGAFGLRYREGRWVRNSNLVYNNYHPDIHLIPKEDFLAADHNWEHFYMGCDWGYKDPGSLSLYGLTFEDQLFQIRTTYRTLEHVHSYWLPRALAYQRWIKMYANKKIQRVFCDPSQPTYIDQFRSAGLPAVKAKVKPKIYNINAVRERLTDGKLFIVRDNIDNLDEILEARHDPTCLADELLEYAHKTNLSNEKLSVRDKNLEDGNDHSADECSYVCGALHTPQVPTHTSSRTFTMKELNQRMGIDFVA